MLEFFRKYQSYFFVVISVVIIISFSFFGTYNTIPAGSIHEAIAFTAVDGTNVQRSELDELVNFISTDSEDKLLFGGAWGPNFLNDGVIKDDILQTGLAQILVAAYPDLVESDLQARLMKEKRYTLYSHPQARFLTVETAWSYVMPGMKAYYEELRRSNNSVDPQAFQARVDLFLAERRFPSPLLRQVLKYQQKQFNWLKPDPNLDRIDLSLFGYHTVDDWFGPRFLRIVGEFIINASKIAEQKGYEVSKNEVLADLMHNADVSFQQNAGNPNLGVSNTGEYFNEQLRRLGMDQTKAIKVWKQVLLFRRLFQDVGNAALIDPLTHHKFYEYAKETVSGELYRLPADMRFADYRSMQKFQVYLEAVAKRPSHELAMPATFLTLEEVKKKYPELVEKDYVLQVAQFNKNVLQSKVGLKEMWNWQAEERNWALLKQQFPELGLKTGDTREDRMIALDNLDDATRARVDGFARKEIVETHPEWLRDSLQQAEPTQMDLRISSKGGKPLFELENREELMALLDNAPIGGQPTTPAAKHAAEKLSLFTGDGNKYYEITVLEKDLNEKIMTFAIADESGALDKILDQKLEAYYIKNRDGKTEFQREDGAWKNFADVKDQVADLYFVKLLDAIRKDYASVHSNKKKQLTTGSQAAPYRFYAYAREIETKLHNGEADALTLISEEGQKNGALQDQWKIEKSSYRSDRSRQSGDLDLAEAFSLPVEGWTAVHAPANGDIYFFHLAARAYPEDLNALYSTLQEAHDMMADDAQRTYMYQLINGLKEKNAISLSYMDTAVQMTPEENEAGE